jgi:hypothetical protein
MYKFMMNVENPGYLLGAGNAFLIFFFGDRIFAGPLGNLLTTKMDYGNPAKFLFKRSP